MPEPDVKWQKEEVTKWLDNGSKEERLDKQFVDILDGPDPEE